MLNIFVRMRQNSCSTAVERINFFDVDQVETENRLLDLILSNGKEESSFFLDKNEKIPLVQTTKTEIYILKHEGDFSIKGKPVACDCNQCLIEVFTGDSNNHHFVGVLQQYYHDGSQYTLLKYSSEKNYPLRAPLGDCLKNRPLLNTQVDSPDRIENEKAYEYYHSLGDPRYFAAPMVGQSELAFRMLLREQGKVDLCYTPMILSDYFLANREYQEELFATCSEDSPLVIQFAANDPDVFIQAARKVERHCKAVDLNLGCPQPTGRRNYYGAWLMEDWSRIDSIIRKASQALTVPVWCKIRIFPELELTVAYAKMIERAGCSLLTVHGRIRARHMNDIQVSWDQIQAVKQALTIPVIANGGISSLTAAEACFNHTECDGVMAASHLLSNPLLLTDKKLGKYEIAILYLEYALKYQAPLRNAKSHVMQLLDTLLDAKSIMHVMQTKTLPELMKAMECVSFCEVKRTQQKSAFDVLFDCN